jgi:hypothetical protein
MGVRLIGRDFTIERRVAKQALLADFWRELAGDSGMGLQLHGVWLR